MSGAAPLNVAGEDAVTDPGATSIALTHLYVPGSQRRRFTRALESGADGVIFDLEDAVAPGLKARAREDVAQFLCHYEGTAAAQVRVNCLDSPWFDDDRAAIRDLPSWVTVRVPKVESKDDVARLAAAFPGRHLHILIETARGVRSMYALAEMPGVASIGLGEADLRSSMFLDGDVTLNWVRAQLVVASQSAGLGAPAMSVYPHLGDSSGLRESTRRGASMGFVGRMVIHPSQIPVVREALRPDRESVDRAQMVVSRMATAITDDQGTVVLEDGTFLDVAMVARARFTMALDRACTAEDDRET